MTITTPAGSATATSRGLAINLALFTIARLAIVAVITGVIMGAGRLVGVSVPLLPALIFGILIALPVSMLVLKGLRARVSSDIATVVERRRAIKQDLHARLRGEHSEELS